MAATGGNPGEYPFPLLDLSDPGQPPPPRAIDVPYAPTKRRLAIVDSHFPWRLSGFRFHEFSEFLRRCPDTVFFSLFRSREPFDVPVFSLSDFPVVAPALGVTDVYAVFLNFVIGITGLGDLPDTDRVWARRDISLAPTLEAYGMNVHITIYPGGGLTADTPNHLVRAAANRATTVFSNVDGIEQLVPDAIVRTGHVVDTTHYTPDPERRSHATCGVVFAADNQPRKGADLAVEAFKRMSGPFHFHVVGPHEHLEERVTGRSDVTFHGWLEPDELRDIFRECAIVIAPARGAGSTESDDRFPTTVVANAMASGCCLVATNLQPSLTFLRPDRDFVEVPVEDIDATITAIERLRLDPARAEEIAANGRAAIAHHMSIAAGVDEKLHDMGIAPSTEARPWMNDSDALCAVASELRGRGDLDSARRAAFAALTPLVGSRLLHEIGLLAESAGSLDLALAALRLGGELTPSDDSFRDAYAALLASISRTQ